MKKGSPMNFKMNSWVSCGFKKHLTWTNAESYVNTTFIAKFTHTIRTEFANSSWVFLRYPKVLKKFQWKELPQVRIHYPYGGVK